MAEEKPISEGVEQNGSTEPNETVGALEEAATEASEAPAVDAASSDADGIAAALSALSSAAAPVREEETVPEMPKPEDAAITFTPAVSEPAAPDTATETASEEQTPPPPPAPEDAVSSYPAPTGAPVAVSVATSAAVPPAPTTKRKKWPWILAICIVAGVLLMGSVVACAATVMNAAFQDVSRHSERHYDFDDLFNHDEQDGLWNYYYGGMGTTFDDLLDYFNIDEGEITTDGVYARGGYRVGGEDGIAPGLYYLEGSQNGVSNFYVFRGSDDADDPEYTIQISAEYFGNYYTTLEEGDAIIFVPFSPNSTMFIAPEQPMDVMPPYRSGCYRVGIDIPAGTYTITCDAEAARETDSEAGAYIMSDLMFNEGSVTESVYVIKGGRQTITVEAGEYLELFAAIATPATASTKVPLQHAESEQSHVA